MKKFFQLLLLSVSIFIFTNINANAAFLLDNAFQQPNKWPAIRKLQLVDKVYSGSQFEFKLPGHKLLKTEKKALSKFYLLRSYEPYWVNVDGINKNAIDLEEYLLNIGQHAIYHKSFQQYLDLIKEVRENNNNLESIIELEFLATKALLAYNKIASIGMVKPSSLSDDIDIFPKMRNPSNILNKLLENEVILKTELDNLQPNIWGYNKLKLRLAELQEFSKNNNFGQINIKKRLLKLGDKDDAIIKIRERLKIYNISLDDLKSNKFDKDFEKAIKSFQAKHSLNADGVIGPGTISYLNRSVDNKIEQLIANMERLRWLPDEQNEKFVLVNQAAFNMGYYLDGKKVFDSRVIVGKPKHKSPMLEDEIEYVVFNPYWNVPYSIASKEILPILQKDGNYLNRNKMLTYDKSGKVIDTSQIDWNKLSAKDLNLRFRQKPGAGNALGNVKFLFPNRHSVYLHDTSARSLFAKEYRALSHGCIRVHKPLDFAENILKHDFEYSIEEIKRRINSGKNQTVSLKTKIPVYLMYLTSWLDDNGEVAFYNDFYKRDKKLIKTLAHHEEINQLLAANN